MIYWSNHAVLTYVEKHANGAPPAYRVAILLEVGTECSCVALLNDVHAHVVKPPHRLVDGALKAKGRLVLQLHRQPPPTLDAS